ncbi:uncharacterized protein [Montipora capricornis]|uniref:uncharacterized protein n=1 Tax=Montipora capricornis TaxID=246305 RepID=UPI0035F1E340
MRAARETSSKGKAGPSISSGLMRKLEPVLLIKKRKKYSYVENAAIQPLIPELQDKITAKPATSTSATHDEFWFPSSPAKKVAKKAANDELKIEEKVSKRDIAKAKNLLKRQVKKEVLEIIRNTRESIQAIRSQLNKNKGKALREKFSNTKDLPNHSSKH